MCNVYDMQGLPDFCAVEKYGGRKALVNVELSRIIYNAVVNLYFSDEDLERKVLHKALKEIEV